MNYENQLPMKKCPFCSGEIPAHAFICKHCGEWLKKMPTEEQLAEPQYSNVQALWRLIILYLITFGLYYIYWFYRNWKHLKIHKNLNISPGLRTAGLLVPILNILFIYRQFRDINNFAKQAGCTAYSSPGWLAIGYALLWNVSLPLFSYGQRLTNPALLFWISILCLIANLLALLLLMPVHKTLNRYWKTEQPDREIRTEFSGVEIAFLLISGLVWFSRIIRILLG